MTSEFCKGAAAVVTVLMWSLIFLSFIGWTKGWSWTHPMTPLIASGWFFGRMMERRIHTGSWT